MGSVGVDPTYTVLQTAAFTGLAYRPKWRDKGITDPHCPGDVLHGVPVSMQDILLAPFAGIEPALSD